MTKRAHSDFTFEFENCAVPTIELNQYYGQLNPDETGNFPDVEPNDEYYDLFPVPELDVPVPDRDVPVPNQVIENELPENRK